MIMSEEGRLSWIQILKIRFAYFLSLYKWDHIICIMFLASFACYYLCEIQLCWVLTPSFLIFIIV